MLTKKHYAAIAEIIGRELGYQHFRDGYHGEAQNALACIRTNLATIFAADNPRFNVDTFYKAIVDQAIETAIILQEEERNSNA